MANTLPESVGVGDGTGNENGKKSKHKKQTKNTEKKHKTKLKTLIAYVSVVSGSFMQNGRSARDARRRAKNE